jgi:hypothetical protein
MKGEIKMKNLIFLLFFILFITVGCTNPKEEDDAVDNSIENPEGPAQSNSDNDNVKKEKDNQEEVSQKEDYVDPGLKSYRPPVGSEKHFHDKHGLLFTEKIVAENDTYVQRVIYLGNSPTVQVLKWTKDEISIVYENRDLANPEKNLLEQVTEDKNPEVLLSINNTTAIWKVIDEHATVSVPYGEYKNVYILSKTTNEVEGEETIYTYYLAPKIGLIKEEFELTGEQGYKAESELKEVN